MHVFFSVKCFSNLTVFRTFKQRGDKAAGLLPSAYIYLLTCSVLPNARTSPVFKNSVL